MTQITDEIIDKAYASAKHAQLLYNADVPVYVATIEEALIAAYPLIRKQVLEEATQTLDRRYMGDNNREDIEVRRCAQAIRDMKEK